MKRDKLTHRDAWRRNLKETGQLRSPRELGLGHCRRLFWFKAANSTMYPRLQKGEAVIARPGVRPISGDDVVIKLKAEPSRYAVLCLLRRTPDSIICRQYKPRRDIEIPVTEIERLWLVLTADGLCDDARATQVRSRLYRRLPTGRAYIDRDTAEYERQRQAVLTSRAAGGPL